MVISRVESDLGFRARILGFRIQPDARGQGGPRRGGGRHGDLHGLAVQRKVVVLLQRRGRVLPVHKDHLRLALRPPAAISLIL